MRPPPHVDQYRGTAERLRLACNLVAGFPLVACMLTAARWRPIGMSLRNSLWGLALIACAAPAMSQEPPAEETTRSSLQEQDDVQPADDVVVVTASTTRGAAHQRAGDDDGDSRVGYRGRAVSEPDRPSPRGAGAQHGADLGARHQRDESLGYGDAVRFAPGPVRRAVRLPRFFRVRHVGFPARRRGRNQAGRDHSGPGFRRLGGQCADWRG